MSLLADSVLWVKLFRAVQIACVLGGIILIHEFGHYLAARLSKMTVDEFAIGIGPTLYKWRRGDTLYRIAPFLFMGYVRIRGLEGEAQAEELPGSFYTRPIPQRLAALLAGAGMNIVCAALIFCAVYGFWGVPERPGTTISKVEPGSAAAVAGLLPGWRIAAVEGQVTAEPKDVRELVRKSAGRPLRMTLEREAERREAVVSPRRPRGAQDYVIGVTFWDDGGYRNVVDRVEPGGPAHRAGLRRGDVIATVNQVPVTNALDLLQAFAAVPKADELKDPGAVTLPPVVLTVARATGQETVVVRPRPKREQRREETPPGQGEGSEIESFLVGDAGIGLQRRFDRLGAAAAVREGFRRSYEVLANVIGQLGILFRGQRLEEVGGPVMIVKFLSEAAFLGAYDLLNWAGLLSIMIGVFNLLPLPALDGGRVLFVLLDPLAHWVLKVVGVAEPQQTSRRVETLIHAVGLLMLLALMVLVSLRDLTRW